MKAGKRICETLKAIRSEIASANDIDYTPTPCTHKGDCSGSCPACEQEIRWLERQLRSRQAMGKAVMIAGLSMALSNIAASAQSQSSKAIEPQRQEQVEQRTMGAVRMMPPELQQLRLDSVYSEVDVEAMFPDGDEAMDSLIRSQLTIPDDILSPIKEIGGKVRARCIVKCLIERDGSMSDATIFQSTSAPIFDNEALRVVGNLPSFYPACIMDVPVRSWKLIPVEFIYDFSRKNSCEREHFIKKPN